MIQRFGEISKCLGCKARLDVYLNHGAYLQITCLVRNLHGTSISASSKVVCLMLETYASKYNIRSKKARPFPRSSCTLFIIMFSRRNRSARQWAIALVLGVGQVVRAFPGETVPVSVNAVEIGAAATASQPSISANGNRIAFSTKAYSIAYGDTNGFTDIFLCDRAAGTYLCVSRGSLGTQANNYSESPSISSDGRFVAFASYATNLVSTNGIVGPAIYVRDTQQNVTSVISISSNGIPANAACYSPQISGDGRFVVFMSSATNLVDGDTNASNDIFVRDTLLGTTSLVSVSSNGTQGSAASVSPTISTDGRYIAFSSSATNLVDNDTNGKDDIFVRDMVSGTTTLVSRTESGLQGDSDCSNPKISENGLAVAFQSSSGNFALSDTNLASDVFCKNLTTGAIDLVSAGLNGSVQPGDSSLLSISQDGNKVLFISASTGFVPNDNNGNSDCFLRNIVLGITERISVSTAGDEANGSSYGASISSDGNFVAFGTAASNFDPNDPGGLPDVYRRDRSAGVTSLVSKCASSAFCNAESTSASIDASGTKVAYTSLSSDVVPKDTNGTKDIFIRDVVASTSQIGSLNANGSPLTKEAGGGSLSADGRYVAFHTTDSSIVTGDNNSTYDVFVRDTKLGTVIPISVNSSGEIGDGISSSPRLSDDGRFVVFDSGARNLTALDTNVYADIFRKDLATGKIEIVSMSSNGQAANGGSSSSRISADGRYVVFVSNASNLVGGDTNSKGDVFLRDMLSGETKLVSVGYLGLPANGSSGSPSVSSDGRYVTFQSLATNLIASDTNIKQDVFVRDMKNGVTALVSISSSGTMANGLSEFPRISADGRYVAFDSFASNLVSGLVDDNDYFDVFVRDMWSGNTSCASISTTGVLGDASSQHALLSADGHFVAFDSYAMNLSELGKDSKAQMFRHEMPGFTSVSGKFNLGSFVGSIPQPVASLKFVPRGAGSTIVLPVVSIEEDGSFTCGLKATGPYDVYATIPRFLRRMYSGFVTLGSGDVPGINFSMVSGDCNGDNYVGTDDYFILSTTFDAMLGTPEFDPRADLNGDGFINTDDYLLLNEAFDKFGD